MAEVLTEKERQLLIEALERFAAFLEKRLDTRTEAIENLETIIADIEAKLYPTAVDRFTVWKHERSLAAYRGWQTRDQIRLQEVLWEIEKLKKPPPPPPLPPYRLVEYTAYFAVIQRTDKTPPIRFEMRGIFTIPFLAELDDIKIRKSVEEAFGNALVQWSREKVEGPLSPMAMAIRESNAAVKGLLLPHFVQRRRGDVFGWFQIKTVAESIDLRNYTVEDATFGVEDVGTSNTFNVAVDVLIVKYIDESKVAGPWYITITVEENSFTPED